MIVGGMEVSMKWDAFSVMKEWTLLIILSSFNRGLSNSADFEDIMDLTEGIIQVRRKLSECESVPYQLLKSLSVAEFARKHARSH